MPEPRGAHVDRVLTNMSVQYIQDARNFIATQVFPIIPVTRQSDLYYIYNQGDFLRDEARIRGAIAESAGGDYRVSTEPYFASKFAFHRDVSQEERLNTDAPLDVDRDTVDFVSQKMLLNREIAWNRKYFQPGVWGTEITGVTTTPTAGQTLQWQLETSNPILDIENANILMAQTTGYKGNVLVLSPQAYTALKNHPDILDRIKYTQTGLITADIMASLFDVDKVVVSWAIVNRAAMDLADPNNTDIGFIAGNHALLVYAPGRAGIRQAAAGYTFTWTGLLGANGIYGNRIVRIPMDLLGLGTVRIEAEIAYDMRVVSPALGVFFNNIATV